MDTVERLAREVYDDMVENEAPAEQISEYVDGVVPSMTTVLFRLVVEDNTLAFLDYEGDGDTTPFEALAGALHQAIEAEVHKLRAADDEDVAEALAEEEEDDGVEVNITAVFADEGSIVVFKATLASDGAEILIAVDHRMAQAIAQGLDEGEQIQVEVAPWQIVGGS